MGHVGIIIGVIVLPQLKLEQKQIVIFQQQNGEAFLKVSTKQGGQVEPKTYVGDKKSSGEFFNPRDQLDSFLPIFQVFREDIWTVEHKFSANTACRYHHNRWRSNFTSRDHVMQYVVFVRIRDSSGVDKVQAFFCAIRWKVGIIIYIDL